MKFRGQKWKNPNLKDWNEKMWNLNDEFCIFAIFKLGTNVHFPQQNFMIYGLVKNA